MLFGGSKSGRASVAARRPEAIEAEGLVDDGRLAEAIELLSAANNEHRELGLEVELRQLRNRFGSTLVSDPDEQPGYVEPARRHGGPAARRAIASAGDHRRGADGADPSRRDPGARMPARSAGSSSASAPRSWPAASTVPSRLEAGSRPKAARTAATPTATTTSSTRRRRNESRLAAGSPRGAGSWRWTRRGCWPRCWMPRGRPGFNP